MLNRKKIIRRKYASLLLLKVYINAVSCIINGLPTENQGTANFKTPELFRGFLSKLDKRSSDKNKHKSSFKKEIV